MKKIVSLLVAMALILSLSATAFAAGEDQTSAVNVADPEFFSQMIAADGSCWFTYTADRATKIKMGNYSSSAFTVADAAGNPIAVDSALEWGNTIYYVELEVAAGETALWQVTSSADDYYYAELNFEGGSAWPFVATVGTYTASVPQYDFVYYAYTPDADGVLTLTIDDACTDWRYAMGADDGWGYPSADASGAIRIEDSDTENDSESEWYPNGHAASRTIEVVAGTTYILEIGTAGDAAGDVTFTLSTEPGPGYVPGGDVGGGDEDDDQGGGVVPENDIAIESYGNADWTAPDDGYVKFTINIPGATLAVLNGYSPLAEGTDSVTVQVTAGTTYGIYPGFDVTTDSIVTWEYVDAPGGDQGGSETEGIPSGSALALGDNNVNITYAPMPMVAPYWTYTATESGYLTVTVDSINGESNLGMAFGRGMYTLLVGETDGQFTNMAVTYVAAGETVNIAVLDTLDPEGVQVPAVLNLAFEAGTPVVEETPDDYFDKDTDGNYIIGSLEAPVDIFVPGGDDICYIYTAEADGVVSFTATVEGFSATNCWFTLNGSCTYNAEPVTVQAGDVVIINIWDGCEGTVSLTAGGGNEDDVPPMEATDAAISKDGIVIPFTPETDGILTITISGTPGYELKVVVAADDSTIGLPKKSSREQTLTFELLAGVTYNICIAGYDPEAWDYADATISYACSFEGADVQPDLVEVDISSTVLVVGEQNVEQLPNTITTLYDFSAPEAGVYTITVPAGVTVSLYTVAWTPYQTSENGTLEFTATEAGQGFLVGLSGEAASFNVTVAKTGTYTPPASTIYENYDPTVTVDPDFEMPEGDVISIDITEEHTAVLGTDGFYHLDSADGPILYVNLNTDVFNLATLLDAGAPITMRGEKYQGEDGNMYCYDYMNMMAYGAYYNFAQTGDYYPLNADLMAFFQDYGAAQGWYMPGLSSIDAINDGTADAESAWMYFAVCVENDNNQGGGDNSQTGDFGIVIASTALTLSAICGTALIAKKKEF